MSSSEQAPQPPAGYLDAVGGQPLSPVAERAWRAAAARAWADPARLHHQGRAAGMLLDASRASIATLLGVRPDEVHFTASGPAAVAIGLAGLVRGQRWVSGRTVIGATEAMVLMSAADEYSQAVDVVPVDRRGRIDLAAWDRALDQPAAAACLQAANAETGTRQPVAQAAAAAHAREVPLFVDATQVVGRDVIPDGWDVLAASARDWGGPPGVGLVVVRGHVRWMPPTAPDRGWIGGFPDIAAAASAAAGLEHVWPTVPAEAARQRALVERLRVALPAAVPGLALTGDPDDRLPHILTVVCRGVAGEALVTELDRRGIAVATGSACTADTDASSHVLAAMGVDADPAAAANLRISLPIGCADATVDALIRELPDAVASLRADFPI